MRIGHDLEEYVAKRFCEATGKKVRRENSILRDPKLPFAHANVDRLIVGEKAGLECKTTSVLNLKRFAGGEFPPNYYVQCQHYMMVTGYETWYLAVLVLGREFLWFEIKRNEEDIEALMQAERDFWKLVENNQEPPVDGTSSCSDTLDKLYPDSDSDVVIDLTPLYDALKQRAEICKQIKALEDQKKA
jgi:predicted phage-related endonuclease